MPTAPIFAFVDSASFDQNLATYAGELKTLDAVAAPALTTACRRWPTSSRTKAALWQGASAAKEKAEPVGARVRQRRMSAVGR